MTFEEKGFRQPRPLPVLRPALEKILAELQELPVELRRPGAVYDPESRHGVVYIPLKRRVFANIIAAQHAGKALARINTAQHEDDIAIAETGRARPLPRRPRPCP